MVSAGNTGAAMAAALLRMGRIKGAARPAIAVPIPVPGREPQVLVDGGANVDCSAEWLRQFAVMGTAYAKVRLGIDTPRVGLLSNGEEAGKGDDLRKQAHALLADLPGFIGNVEGRDFMQDTVDVIVTDGFTGNVALKTVEGAIRGTARLVFEALNSTPEVAKAAEAVMPALLSAADTLDPDGEGGCVLLGIGGVCIISHGSSNARAIHSATRRAGRLRRVARRRPGQGGDRQCRLRPISRAVRSVPTRCSRSCASGSPRSSRSTRTPSRSTRASRRSTPTRSR